MLTVQRKKTSQS